MKLFAFQPNGHGELSFFVCAETKDEAISAVDKYIEKHLNQHNFSDKNYLGNYEIAGWGTDYYDCTEVNVGEVITNENS